METKDRTTKEKLREIMNHKQQVIEQQAQEMALLKNHHREAEQALRITCDDLQKRLLREIENNKREAQKSARYEQRIKTLTTALKDVSVESCF